MLRVKNGVTFCSALEYGKNLIVFPRFEGKRIRGNEFSVVPFSGNLLAWRRYTVKIGRYTSALSKNAICDSITLHEGYSIIRSTSAGENIFRECKFSMCYDNKTCEMPSKENASGNASKNGVKREASCKEEKIPFNSEGEKYSNSKYVNEQNSYNVKNKILNRHECVHLSLLNVDEEIINNLKFILKIEKLFMYQYIVYNEILVNSCKHVLVYNKTGTGKTLSYLLPLIQKLVNENFDCNQRVLILTQNIYLCKQLYIYILSIYPNLNVLLCDENESYDSMNRIKYNVINKECSVKKEDNKNLYRQNYGIHFYLCTPNRLEFYIKNYKNKKKNDKNVMNNILNCVKTIVVDEFDYIAENRKLIFNFLFQTSGPSIVDNEKRGIGKDFPYDKINREQYNIYLFTANMNDLIKRKINEHLIGFVFLDFINGLKETIQKKINDERSKVFSKNTENVMQLLSKENKNSSMCNLNISHFICKMNTPYKYKYVSYFLNEFFFVKNEDLSSKKKPHNIFDKNDKLADAQNDECDANKLITDYMRKNNCGDFENEEKINKCIIFANSKEEVEKLYENALLKPHAVMMHSELLTVQKNENINLFKLGKKNILITTDIVSRGLDIENVIFILNYSPPTSPNDYIHRSGRTGRAKEKGICLTMYHKYEYKNLEKIMKYTKNKFQVILCPHIDEVYKFSVDKLIGTIMKIPPYKYEFLNDKSKELLKSHDTKIVAQILSILLKFDKKSDNLSLLSGKKNYVAVLIKDPFFEVIKSKDDIINMLKVTTGNKNISSIIGDVAKCDEGYIADISSTQVNKIITLFNSSKSEYKNKGLEISTIIELPPIIKEKKNIIRKNKKVPWIK